MKSGRVRDFSLGRMLKTSPQGKIIYRAERPECRRFPQLGDGDLAPGPSRNFEVFDPLDFIAEITQHIPDPGMQIIRYYGWHSNRMRGDRAKAAVVAAELARRKALPQIEVQARLVAKSNVPDPGQMAPYHSALVVNEYEVEKVLKGAYAGKTIRVAQWGIIDLKPTPLAAQEPGASVKLVLEKFTDHDELVPELISDTLEENFDLNLYTDVNLDEP